MEAFTEAQALASLQKRPDCVLKPEEKEGPGYEGKVRSYKEAGEKKQETFERIKPPGSLSKRFI